MQPVVQVCHHGRLSAQRPWASAHHGDQGRTIDAGHHEIGPVVGQDLDGGHRVAVLPGVVHGASF